jgi:hypothetical protein
MESAIPTLVGIGWAVLAWRTEQGWYATASGFGIAFLFALSVQGQLFRIDKNVRDEKAADEFRNSFVTLLSEVRSITYTVNTDAQHGSQGFDYGDELHELNRGMFIDLHQEFVAAGEAINAGDYHTGALTAANAYSRALRIAARQLGIPETHQIDEILPQILSGISNDRLTRRLHLTEQLRIDLLDAKFRALVMTRRDASDLDTAFLVGINALKIVTETLLAVRPHRSVPG